MIEIETLESVSLKIKNTRKSLNISQKKLAKFVGISQSTVARLESDIKRMNPSYNMVYNVLDSMGQLARTGRSSEILNKEAHELMHRHIYSIKKTQRLKEAIKIMKNNDFSQLPVLNGDGTVVGTVHQKRLLNIATQDLLLVEKMRVSEVLDPSLPQVDMNTPVSKLKPILQNWDAVLVIEKGKLVGIITIYDLFRIL